MFFFQPAGSAQASGASHNSGVTQPAGCSTNISRSIGVIQPAGSTAATNVSEQLVQGVLDNMMGDVTDIVAQAHYHTYEPLPALDKARKEVMRTKTFGPTLNSLQRSYSKLLHETFENEWSSEVYRNVRDLADAIVWKLSVKSQAAAQEGQVLMIKMLEHLQVEFKWEKNVKILEAATDIARIEKANAYKRAKTCEVNLREKRHS